jgi:uncharacterized membrane protein YcfT
MNWRGRHLGWCVQMRSIEEPQPGDKIARAETNSSIPSTSEKVNYPPGVRIPWVDTARGLAILLVVLYHSILFSQGLGLSAEAWRGVNYIAKFIRMPLFFFVSGMLAARAVERSWGVLLRGRIGSNLWVYALWSALIYILLSFLPDVDPSGPTPTSSWSEWFSTTFVVPSNSLWYLLALPTFIAVARVTRRVCNVVLLSGAAILSGAASAGFLIEFGFVWYSFVLYFVYFMFGARLGGWISSIALRMSRAVIVLPCSVAWVGLVLLDAFLGQNNHGVPLILGAAAVVIGVSMSALLSKTWVSRPLAVLGRSTLPVYVLHWAILHVLASIVLLMALPSSESVGMFLPALFAVITVPTALGAGKLIGRVPGLFSAPWSPHKTGI